MSIHQPTTIPQFVLFMHWLFVVVVFFAAPVESSESGEESEAAEVVSGCNGAEQVGLAVGSCAWEELRWVLGLDDAGPCLFAGACAELEAS